MERLMKAMEGEKPIINEAKSSGAPNRFDMGSTWRLLEPLEEVREPENVDPALVDPSRARDQRTSAGVGTRDNEFQKKFNYAEKFSRDAFVATALQFVQEGETEKGNNNKKRKRKSPEKKKERKYEKRPIKKLIPNIKFTQKHHLNEFSNSAEWFRAFIPETQKKGDPSSSCIHKWCQYTNMKAELDFAGNKNSGGLSYKFVPFTPREIEQHLAIYMIQGLNPSPQLRMKMRHQVIEPLQGNDLICMQVGDNFNKSA